MLTPLCATSVRVVSGDRRNGVDMASGTIHRGAFWTAHRRLRFDLKAWFLLTTAVCLALGYSMARQLRAEQIRARHFALVNLVNHNSSTVPPGARVVPSRGARWRGTTDYSSR